MALSAVGHAGSGEQGGASIQGNWRADKGTNALGQQEYIDMELRPDGTGFFGEGIRENNEEKYLPFLSFSIRQWHLMGDTLVVEGELDPTQAMGGAAIQAELAGISIKRYFVLQYEKDNEFKGLPVEPDARIVKVSPDKLRQFTFKRN
ncbi:MAG: hypothetical protein H6585_00675 [Flavobacteriales bacterium]|nr:hypothetical protein [Flavobacteriales bacterium]MCB9446840.1 hypothetical protein [Flavobacteriales bacterium]